MIEANRRTGVVCVIVIILFLYAYKTFKEKSASEDSTSDKKEGLLSKIRNKAKKKVTFKDNPICSDAVTNEIDKDKINSMVKEILLRQVPSSQEGPPQ